MDKDKEFIANDKTKVKVIEPQRENITTHNSGLFVRGKSSRRRMKPSATCATAIFAANSNSAEAVGKRHAADGRSGSQTPVRSANSCRGFDRGREWPGPSERDPAVT